MKLSIVAPVYNSHEIVRRQVLYYDRMRDADSDWELVIVDDSSDPPLEVPSWVKHARREDTDDWTTPRARNLGAKIAAGEWLIMIDIDYIVPRELIEDVKRTDAEKMTFIRKFGMLDAYGRFTDDPNALRAWGLTRPRDLHPMRSIYAMRRQAFFDIGGYRENLVGPEHRSRSSAVFCRTWRRSKRPTAAERPLIYMFPIGKYIGNGRDKDANPFGFFHDMKR